MRSSLKHIADYAHDWLHTTSETDQTIWILVDSRDDGIDLARRLFQLKHGEHVQTEVTYDTLPTYMGDADRRNFVFILSQPNHIETVLVTMQDTTADMRYRDVAPKEVELLRNMTELNVTPEELVYLDQQKTTSGFRINPLTEIIVDQQEPLWDVYKPYIGPKTQVRMTDNVRVQAPRRVGS